VLLPVVRSGHQLQANIFAALLNRKDMD